MAPRRIPASLRRFFWDHGEDLRWPDDRETIIPRILAVGTEAAIRWLHGQLGDEALRAWIVQNHARGLRPQQIAFWGIVLHLPSNLTKLLIQRSQVPGGLW